MKIRTNFIIQIFAHGFQRIKPIYTDKKIRVNPPKSVLSVSHFYLFFTTNFTN